MRNRRSRGWHVFAAAFWATFAASRGLAQDSAGTGSFEKVHSRTVVQVAKTVTLALENVTVREALYAVAKDAGLAVSFNGGDSVLKSRLLARVTLKFNDVPLADALAQVMNGTGYTARISDDGTAVMIVRVGTPRRKDKRGGGTISGHVTDSATARPIANATVSIKGRSQAATTNAQGQFTMTDVPDGEYLLTVRLFGYRPGVRTITIGDSESVSLQIALVSAPNVLTGVVTTATGSQERRAIGNSITTLNVDEILQTAPVKSVADVLDGRVPGLEVTRTSGIPGAPSRVRIRGTSSITGNNDPILVIDGVRQYAAQSDARNQIGARGNVGANANSKLSDEPGAGSFAAPSPLDQIDINTIERIDVFKGSSASAMYGADAANGVIVITTKKGRPGKLSWTTSVNSGISYIPGDYPLNVVRWGHAFNQPSRPYTVNNPFATDITFDSVTRFQALNDSRFTVLSHGYNTDGSATVSGGNAATTYSMTVSGGQIEGVLRLPDIEVDRYRKYQKVDPPSWMRRPDQLNTWGTSGQIVVTPSSSFNVSYTGGVLHTGQQQSSLQSSIATLMGVYIDSTQLDPTPLVGDFYQRARVSNYTINNGLSPHWQPKSWLSLIGTLGLNIQVSDRETLLPRGLIPSSLDSTGRYSTGRNSAITKTLTVGAPTLPVPFFRWTIPTSIGVNMVQTNIQDNSLATNTLQYGETSPSNFINATGTQYRSNTTTYGWWLEPKINSNSTFFLTPGIRIDGGSSYGNRARVGGLPSSLSLASLFPELAFSWVMSDQRWFPWKSQFNVLRLRGSVSHASVQPQPGQKLRVFDNSVHMLNGLPTTDLAILNSLGNTELRPERDNDVEGGFEVTTLANRVTVDFTAYRRHKVDAIIQVPVAPSVGGGNLAQNVNVGNTLNTGVEATTQLTLLQNRNVYWSVNTMLSTDNNVVQQLAPGVSNVILSNTSRIVPGYPLLGRWALPIVGYADLNHDGVVRFDEIKLGDSLVYLGRQDPKYSLNGGTDLALFHGTIKMSAQFKYVNGQTQFNDGGSAMLAQLANDPTLSPAEQAAFAGLSGDHQTVFGLVQTVQSLELQSFSVSYEAPKSWSRLFRAAGMTIGLQGGNLGLWTNYRGKDPNVNALSIGNETGDMGQVPNPRTWALHVSLRN